MQYKSLVFGQAEDVPEFGTYDSTDVEFVANAELVHRINVLARDENWEINLVNLDDMATGTGFVLLQRGGFVPSTY